MDHALQGEDFSLLTESQHMLEWLADEPFKAIRASFHNWVKRQVAGSEVESLRFLAAPEWLTRMRRQVENSENGVLVRAGFAVLFEAGVFQPSGERHLLSGVFTWVATHLDTPNAKHQMWFDLDGTLDSHGSNGALAERLNSNV
jgi:hypothetical protein